MERLPVARPEWVQRWVRSEFSRGPRAQAAAGTRNDNECLMQGVLASHHRHDLGPLVVIDRQRVAITCAVRRDTKPDQLHAAGRNVNAGVGIFAAALLAAPQEPDDAAFGAQL